jgi:hypothetical protein
MLQTIRPANALQDNLSILWWRAVLLAARTLHRALAWACPVLLPLRPFWWVPIPFSFLGFLFGLTAALIVY